MKSVKKSPQKKYPCRFPDCEKSFKNRSGLSYHEKHQHGSLFTKQNKHDEDNQKNTENNTKNNDNFVLVRRVKYTMAEEIKTKDKKDTEDKYCCGACKSGFNEKKKYCPNCGVEFA